MEAKNTRKKIILAAAVAGLVSGSSIAIPAAFADHHKEEKKMDKKGEGDQKEGKKHKSGDSCGDGCPSHDKKEEKK